MRSCEFVFHLILQNARSQRQSQPWPVMLRSKARRSDAGATLTFAVGLSFVLDARLLGVLNRNCASFRVRDTRAIVSFANQDHAMRNPSCLLSVWWVVLSVVAWCCAGLQAAEIAVPIRAPSAADILGRLRSGHPRLLASQSDFERLRTGLKNDPTFRDWHAKLAGRADRLLAETPSKYEIPDGLRLLSVSRRVLDRLYTLALIYRIGGESKYAERAWRELEAAAAFPDWNPRHFLDTAEMTHAFAIGYDWLYEFWTPAQLGTIRKAIVEKGLRPALECYQGRANYGRWMKVRHNWNQVCNGGIGMGALALCDVEPDLATEFLRGAIESIQLAMREFAPDGAWAEGPGYWNYATQYNVAFLAALRTALGTDFGLSDMAGFSDAGLFPIYINGPINRTFNYADGGDGAVRAPQMQWLAQRFNRPQYAAYQRVLAAPHPLDLLWFDPELNAMQTAELPLDRRFRTAELATFRSAWRDREALFVGFKGGDNKANHSHLDLGTFVLDGGGVRWILDAGADNYNLPGYFGRERWTYYRLRAEGHNTLVINPDAGPDQEPAATAPITRYESRPNAAFAIADLSAAYAKQAQSVKRGIALVDRSEVIVQDEIALGKGANMWWFAHTSAEVELIENGKAAVLAQEGRRLMAQLSSAPASARFEVLPARPLPTSPNPSNQASNERTRKLAVRAEGKTGDTITVTVSFVLLPKEGPVRSGTPAVLPIDSWGARTSSFGRATGP